MQRNPLIITVPRRPQHDWAAVRAGGYLVIESVRQTLVRLISPRALRPLQKSFEKFDLAYQPSIAGRQILELRPLRFIHELIRRTRLAMHGLASARLLHRAVASRYTWPWALSSTTLEPREPMPTSGGGGVPGLLEPMLLASLILKRISMPSPRTRRDKLADKICSDQPLTTDEHLQFLELIDQTLTETVTLPESNLIPWPDPEELRRLFERAVRRRYHEQA